MYSTSSGTEPTSGRARLRRALLTGGLAASVFVALGPAIAHTPYRQWKVYRQRHLMLGASREDPATYPMAKELQALLNNALPEASARVARARTRRRLADLLATDQIHTILLSRGDAVALSQGQDPFDYPVEIRALARFGNHVLVSSPSFPASHAWVLTRIFLENGDRSAELRFVEDLPIPLHEGTRIAHAGGEQPAPPESVEKKPRDETHAH